MSWLAIILFIIKMVPEIIKIVQAIIDFFKNRSEAHVVKAEFTAAIRSGDLDKVREVAHHWHKKCVGVACPADLVGE